MNTMLELSMDADYDTFAAFAIIAIAVTAKLWPAVKKQLERAQP